MDEHFAAVKARRARGGYQGVLKDRGVPRTKFDAALLALIGAKARTGATGLRDGRRAKMLAALDYEATWTQIRVWRRGYRRAPQWAIDKVNAKIDAHVRELREAIEALAATPASKNSFRRLNP